MAYSLAQIADEFSLDYEGDGELAIAGLCGLSDNLEDHLSFISSVKLLDLAEGSNMCAFVTLPGYPVKGKTNLFPDNPNYAIAKIAQLFVRHSASTRSNVHPSAIIDATATIAASAVLGANVVIGAHTTVGERSTISAGCIVLDRVNIGDDCMFHPNCVVRERCSIGDRALFQPGVVIGGDGFGYIRYEQDHVKIPQLGNVIIESDVEIGANSSVDRARFTSTLIRQGTKIDNGVVVAHNVQVGERCIIVAQCGLSGSSRIGDDVVLAGQTGLVGHIEIANGVTVLGKSMVTKDIREPKVIWGGSPARPAKLWKRAIARLYAGIERK